MNVVEWFRCAARGEHQWQQPFLRTQPKCIIKVCRRCGRTKKTKVW